MNCINPNIEKNGDVKLLYKEIRKDELHFYKCYECVFFGNENVLICYQYV